jgi:hypothetical protein
MFFKLLGMVCPRNGDCSHKVVSDVPSLKRGCFSLMTQLSFMCVMKGVSSLAVGAMSSTLHAFVWLWWGWPMSFGYLILDFNLYISIQHISFFQRERIWIKNSGIYFVKIFMHFILFFFLWQLWMNQFSCSEELQICAKVLHTQFSNLIVYNYFCNYTLAYKSMNILKIRNLNLN